MCNKPMYRLVVNEGVEEFLRSQHSKILSRLKSGGILMSRIEFEYWCNRGLTQDMFQTIPCGQCYGCLNDYQRQWTTRALLESEKYKENYFVTLTYNEENINLTPIIHPASGEIKYLSNLVKEDFTAFFKRLRARLEYLGFESPRFLACGEYGDTTKRSHFHFLGFNLHIPDLTFYYFKDINGKISFNYKPNSTPYYLSDIISECWGKGFILITPLTAENCSYVCSYVNKQISPKQIKLANGSEELLNNFKRQFDNNVLTHDNAVKLGLVHSPFLHMSRRNGLAYDCTQDEKTMHDYWYYEKLPFVNGKPCPKNSLRYFDNKLKDKDESLLEDLKQKRLSKIKDKPYLQWSDYGQRKRDIKEEILSIKHKKKKPRDL